MDPKKKKKTNKITIKDPNYNSISSNYEQGFYVTEKITQNHFLTNHPLNYKYYYVSMCPNGGFIAICKVPKYTEIGTKNPALNNIIVMHQDGKNIYKINYKDLSEKKRSVVSLVFNYKEQLYAFCDDGEIFKIDILKESAQKLDFYSTTLINEKILKAKAFGKGFIILTGAGTIFYLKDLKSKDNPLEFVVSLRDNLKIKNFTECDFLVIPSTESESDEELLINNPNGEGVFLIKKNKSIGSEFRVQTTNKTQNYSDRKINAYYINSNNVEVFNAQTNQVEDEDFETKFNDTKKIGKVSGMTISSSNKKIALYVAKKRAVYIFSSNIPSDGVLNEFQKIEYKIEPDEFAEEGEEDEKDRILNFINKQLIFMTDECVGICGGRWVIMAKKVRKKVKNKNKEEIVEYDQTWIENLSVEKSKNDIHMDNPYIYCKGTTEVDGIRIITSNEIYLFRKVPDYLKPVFSNLDNPTRQLISSYEKFLNNDPYCNEELREIKETLSDEIFTLVKAAGYLYWVEENKETTEQKELQHFFLRAANYGKSIFGKAEFNFDKFNNLCMNLRIINALRNFKEKPRFLTLEEYENLSLEPTDNIVKKTMRQLNFKLAFKIAKYLNFPEKDVYLKYAFKTIKKIVYDNDEEANAAYNKLMPMLKNLENISYIDIAKKCIKYHKNKLGAKFLENEKSSIVKIPQYFELKDWKKSIELAIQSNDNNALMIVLDNIYKVEAKSLGSGKDINKVFIRTLLNYPSIKIQVINYLKKNNKIDDLLNYLENMNDNEELFYLFLEQFFSCKDKSEREEILKKLKNCKPEKFDKKFYENYISDLESSLKFKKECIDKGIFDKNDTTNFDNSIYDCFEKAITKEYDWIKKENSNYFKLSTRKITILRLKELFKEEKFDEIDKLLEGGIKKLEISYIKVANMFLENGKKEKAIEFALKENNDSLLEEKINLLIKLEKYEDAAEAALKIKDEEKCLEKFNNIGSKLGNDPARREGIQKIFDRRK